MSNEPISGAPVTRSRKADLVVLVVLASLSIAYLFDAYRASPNIMNLVLIVPVTIIVFVLCAVQFVVTLRKSTNDIPEREPVRPVLPVMILFAVYVLSLPWLGFDLGTALFVGVFLYVHGERRWIWVLGYSVSFSSCVTLFFSYMLPYPMPLRVFG
ncbi:MAG: tripartite tricarboxylate transporter TctB family protein [Pseudomonadota bacterium]